MTGFGPGFLVDHAQGLDRLGKLGGVRDSGMGGGVAGFLTLAGVATDWVDLADARSFAVQAWLRGAVRYWRKR